MSIRIPIVSQFSDKGVKQAEKAFGSLKNSSDKIGKSMKVAGVAAAAGLATAAYAALDFAKAAMEDEAAAAQLANTLKNTTGATDAQIASVERWITSVSLATGTADSELRPALSQISRATKDVTKAQKLLTLAQDVSAATQRPLAATSKAIAQAYGGQFGALKKLSPETAKLIKAGASADEVFKSLESTFKGAADTAANTTAGKFQRFKVAVDELKEGLGAQLLPVMSAVSGFAVNKLIPAFQGFQDSIGENGFSKTISTYFSKGWQWITQEGIPTLQTKLQEMSKALVDWIGPRIQPFVSKLGELIAAGANWILDVGLPLFLEKFKELGSAFVAWIKPNIAPMLKELGKLIGVVAEWLVTVALPKLLMFIVEFQKTLVGWARDLAPSIISGLISAFGEIAAALGRIGKKLLDAFIDLGKKLGKAIANGAIDGLNKIIGGLNDLLEFKISLPFGKSFTVNAPDIPNIPKLADGGIVNKPGGTLALIGEAGPEAVIPLSKMDSMGGPTFVIQTGVGDPVAIGREIERVMQRYQRRTGVAA
jgi:hypothetical protein